MVRRDSGAHVKAELDEATFQALTRLSEEGNNWFEEGKYPEALEHYRRALQMIPKPLEEWEASTWVLAGIADCLFLMRDYDQAAVYLEQVLGCPGAFGNEFIHLRIGQTALERGEEALAKEHLARAYMGGGQEIFEGEDPKYLHFLRRFMKGI